MKKYLQEFLIVMSFILLAIRPSAAQNAPAFPAGSNVLNIGIGLWGSYAYRGDYYGPYNHRSYYIPNISVSLDHGLSAKGGPGTWGLGGIVAIRGSYYNQLAYVGTYPQLYYDERRWTDVFLGARLTYHLGLNGNNKFDFYPGLSLGVVVSRYSFVHPLIGRYGTPPNDWYLEGEQRTASSASYPAAGLFLGFRYNFTQQIGIFSEFGWEFTGFKIGLAIKF